MELLLLHWSHLHPQQIVERGHHNFFYCLGVANGFIHNTQVFLNLLGLDRVLGKDGVGYLLPVCGFVYLAGNVGLGLSHFIKIAKIKGKLEILFALYSWSPCVLG